MIQSSDLIALTGEKCFLEEHMCHGRRHVVKSRSVCHVTDWCSRFFKMSAGNICLAQSNSHEQKNNKCPSESKMDESFAECKFSCIDLSLILVSLVCFLADTATGMAGLLGHN